MSATILLILALLFPQGIPFGTGNQRNAGGKSTLATDNFMYTAQYPLCGPSSPSPCNWALIDDSFAQSMQLGYMGSGTGYLLPDDNSAISGNKYSAVLPPADQWETITIGPNPDATTAQEAGAACRVDGSRAGVFYVAYEDSYDGELYLGEDVVGSITVFGQVAQVAASGDSVGISCQGTTIKALYNGITKITHTDSDLTTGFGGVYYGNPASTGDWTAISVFTVGACNGAC